MRSLLTPLALGLAFSLAVVFGVQWSIVQRAIDAVLVDYIEGELAQDAAELFGSLAVLPDGASSLALTHFDPPFLQPYSGRYYQILLGAEVALRSPSLADATLAMTPVGPDRSRRDFVAGPAGQQLLLHTIGHEILGRRVTIGVAEDVQPIRLQFERFMERYSKISAVMFALLLLLQLAVVRLSLGTLRRIAGDVRRLEDGEIGQLGERVPSEVLPLVREINRLVALLTARLERSREALGNLAHALKTPLAVLQHMADDERLERDPGFAAELTEQVDVLRSRVDTELRRARVAGGRAAGPPVAVQPQIEALAGTLRKLHRDRAIAVECRIDPQATFNGDREDFVELCGNLLDNACKWATGRARVSAQDGAALVLTVEDDGPGCSPEDLERLGRRGLRLDETTEGHGLGLAIVESIVASYGADIRFGRSPDLGGFAVTVTFPRVRRPAA